MMQSHHKRLLEFFGAISGGWISWLTDHAHGIAGGIAYYGGAVVAILSGISFAWDILNKWKHRKD